VLRKLALFTISFACLSGIAMAQDAKSVIAAAKKALGDPTSITYSGSAKDVSFQQCGANATQIDGVDKDLSRTKERLPSQPTA